MFVKDDSQLSKAAVALAIAGALALPGVAQASTNADAKVAAEAGAHASVHVEQVARLADETGAAAQARARALVNRSRGELRRAVARTRTLLEEAQAPVQVDVAARTAIRVSSTLAHDSELQAKIAMDGTGKLERQASKALIGNVHMQQAVISAALHRVGARAEQGAQDGVRAGEATVRMLSRQIEAAAATAASVRVGARAQASADLAVAIGTDALSANAQAVSELQARVTGETQESMARVRQGLADTAERIAGVVSKVRIDDNLVSLDGHGRISLGELTRLGVQMTASTSVDAQMSGPSAGAQGQANIVAGLLGGRR
jgi:hypothetical protein